MKKLITSILVLFALTLGVQAQETTWNNIMVTTTNIPGADTAYFSIICRGGSYQSLCQTLPDSITTNPNPLITDFAPGDSLVWKIEKGAAYGTSPRVRVVNVQSGQYLYFDTKADGIRRAYMGDRNLTTGVKDFILYYRGPRVPAEPYYTFGDAVTGALLGSKSAGTTTLGVPTDASQAAFMWRFNVKTGPTPKVTLPTPALELSTVETTFGAGESATLKAKVIKGATDLLGNAVLYNGTTVLDTLALDANGEATYVHNNLIYGTEKFALVYEGDVNYDPIDSVIAISVGPNSNALSTKVELSIPATAETNSEVTLSINVKTAANDPVPQGDVVVSFNGVPKDRLTLDVLGMASVTYPNLTVGADTITATYFGDNMAYLTSDPSTTYIDITPSTKTVKPYPVFFDLGQQPEILKYKRMYTTASTTLPITVNFSKDSLAGITIENDTTGIVTYYQGVHSYTNSDTKDYYMNSDQIQIPLGSNRSKWVNFRTPWLNEGSYNIYISHRVSGSAYLHMTSVMVDGKEVYFPNEDMYGRWFRSWDACNNRRRWNATKHSGNLGMNYIGSVKVDKSDVHNLKLTLANENGATVPLDMIQFVPCEMDSIKQTNNAKTNMAKDFYPLFDLGGFARMQGDVAVASFADETEMAVPYQAVDQTEWEKLPFTIDSLMNTYNELEGNYVIVYHAEDMWTRVAEGMINDTDSTFSGELPKGNYYYQEINYIDLGAIGANGYRSFISDGFFNVGGGTAVSNPINSNIKVIGRKGELTVKGQKAGSRILVVDLTGRLVVNTVSTSTEFTKSLSQGAYIVKVIGNDTMTTKVLVK